MEDSVFFAAILTSPASIVVSIGGVAQTGVWDQQPSNGVGLYRGRSPFGSRTGQVIISLVRNGVTLLSSTGDSITATCTQGLQNWNPYVIGNDGRGVATSSLISLSESGCISGFGDERYQGLCEFACKYNYCPRGACTCTNMVSLMPSLSLEHINIFSRVKSSTDRPKRKDSRVRLLGWILHI